MLTGHIKSHNKNNKLLSHKCALVVSTERILKNHIATLHGGVARFLCEFEGCTFETNLTGMVPLRNMSKVSMTRSKICLAINALAALIAQVRGGGKN